MLSLPSEATLAGSRVVATFEGAECAGHGDDEILAVANRRISTQESDCDQEREERCPQLLDRLVEHGQARHVANLVEPEVDVGDGEDLVGLLNRLLHEPGLQEPCQVRTFDDVDTLDGNSGSHPTNLSVRLS